jgi:hypothetical protein
LCQDGPLSFNDAANNKVSTKWSSPRRIARKEGLAEVITLLIWRVVLYSIGKDTIELVNHIRGAKRREMGE